MLTALLIVAGFAAGVQNALAGGGSFVTFPALLLFGLGARAANITSTMALFPGQVATGWAGRRQVMGAKGISFRTLNLISLGGGAVGALLLLATPEHFFQKLVPFLVLFATIVFAWGSFRDRRPGSDEVRLAPALAAAAQCIIAIYGGYFGGGFGMLMLAVLTLAGLPVHAAGATKNVLSAVTNASAVAIFAFSADVHWLPALATGVGAIAGGQVGTWLMLRINERALRLGIVATGSLLTIALFGKTFL